MPIAGRSPIIISEQIWMQLDSHYKLCRKVVTQFKYLAVSRKTKKDFCRERSENYFCQNSYYREIMAGADSHCII